MDCRASHFGVHVIQSFENVTLPCSSVVIRFPVLSSCQCPGHWREEERFADVSEHLRAEQRREMAIIAIAGSNASYLGVVVVVDVVRIIISVAHGGPLWGEAASCSGGET